MMESPQCNEGSAPAAPAAAASALAPHLTCAICREIYYKPVTLPCGHSHCHHCLLQVINATALKTSEMSTCPECRTVFGLRIGNFAPATALWNVVRATFPGVVDTRAADCDYLYARESAKIVGFEHGPLLKTPADGEFAIDNLKDSRRLWRSVRVPEEAPTMRRALAFTTFPRSIVEGCRRLRVGVALLHMEEDEYTEDGGFPILIRDDDEAFVDRNARGTPVTVTLFPVETMSAELHPPSIPRSAQGSSASMGSSTASADSLQACDSAVHTKNSCLSQGRAEVFFNCRDGLPAGLHQLHCTVGASDVLSMTFLVHAEGKRGEEEEEEDGDSALDGGGSPRRRDLVVMSSDSEEEELSGEDDYDDGDGFVVADDVIEYSSGAEEVTVLDDCESDIGESSGESDSSYSSDESGGVLSSGRNKRQREDRSSEAKRDRMKRRRQVAGLLDDSEEED